MVKALTTLPGLSVSRPKFISEKLFFQVFIEATPIAFAQLCAKTENKFSSGNDPQVLSTDVSYCLKNIEVAQNYRNMGVGSALLAEVIEFCRDSRVSHIYGQAKGELPKLRRWYAEMGFDLDSKDRIQLILAAVPIMENPINDRDATRR